MRIHHAALLLIARGGEARGEIVEIGRRCVLRQIGVVLVGERAPQGIHTEIFTPFESFEERDAVEDLAIQVPRNHGRDIAVVHEFHVLDEVEHRIFFDIRGVGPRHEQEGEGDAVPLGTGFHMRLELTPRLDPPALVDAQLGVVVGVVAPEVFHAHGVAERKNRCVVVGAHAALLGVDEGGTGLIFEQERNVAGVQERHVHGCGIQPRGLQLIERCRAAESQGSRGSHRLIEEGRGGFVAVVLNLGFDAEAVLPFAFEVEFQVPVVHHVVDVGPFPR